MIEFEKYSEDETQEVFDKYPVTQRYTQILQTQSESFDAVLRKDRHRAWLNCVFATHFKSSSTADICSYWSQEAHRILVRAWQSSGLSEEPLCLFALGKLGSNELNLSSDVDLLLVSYGPFSPSTKLQRFQKSLQQVNEMGFCFRLDFDLRPGGRFGPLISSVDQFEDYYGTFGATWERMALIRLRGIAGPIEEIQKIYEIARKFTFRRYIDYTLFEDFKELRPQIHAVDPKTDEQFNLKLHPGGIRDIELYVHAMQVIHGGKDSSLHTHSTSEALDALVQNQLLPKDVADFLGASYWHLRHLENRSQAKNDLQVHTLDLDKIDREEFNEMVNKVDETVSDLLGGARTEENPLPLQIEDHAHWFTELGYDYNAIQEPWSHLIDMKARSSSQQRDEKERRRFLSSFVKETQEVSLDKELAIHHLNDFIGSTRAKASFFTMFNREPRLIRDLAFLMSLSPYLAQVLSRRPELLDSFLLQVDEPAPKDFEEALDAFTDQRLLTEIITAQNFLPQRNISLLVDALSERADIIASHLLERLKIEIELESSTVSILTMGKWAGYELGFRSDLDFIFVSQGPVNEEDHKIARRFLNALSTPTRGGQVYNFDLRLRPSGNSGPLIVSVENLEEFLRNKAQPWERQAYTKSRFLGPSPYNIRQILASSPLSKEDLIELRKIRTALKKENLKASLLDLKYAPGGLVDIEFAVQTYSLWKQIPLPNASTLQGLRTLAEASKEWKSAKKQLTLAYNRLREFEQLNQLCSNQAGSVITPQGQPFARIARLYQREPHELAGEIQGTLDEAADALRDLDPCFASE